MPKRKITRNKFIGIHSEREVDGKKITEAVLVRLNDIIYIKNHKIALRVLPECEIPFVDDMSYIREQIDGNNCEDKHHNDKCNSEKKQHGQYKRVHGVNYEGYPIIIDLKTNKTYAALQPTSTNMFCIEVKRYLDKFIPVEGYVMYVDSKYVE